MKANLLFVHALSPLHAGTGQGVGVIDLPIAREKSTGLPYLPGSSVKGTFRDMCPTDRRDRIFGPGADQEDKYQGSIIFSDQRLLLLPVRSLAGTFAWVTSPYILKRFIRDAKSTDIGGIPGDPSWVESPERCTVCETGCRLLLNDEVVLEDLDLKADKTAAAQVWADWLGTKIFPGDTEWQGIFVSRFAVIHDEVMTFLLDTATEITARIKLLENAKTVQKGGLWYEEALPAETILSGLVGSTPVKSGEEEISELLSYLASKPAQFGGKATVGRGLCRLQIA